MTAEKFDKKLLVLDLDGTLIFAEYAAEIPNVDQMRKCDFEIYQKTILVWKRPNLDDFLEWCFSNFCVAIWSAAGKEYVSDILENILKPHMKPLFVWSNERCTKKYLEWSYYGSSEQWVYHKRLSKIWRTSWKAIFNRHNTLILDDTPATYSKNYGNAIPIPSYEAEDVDSELIEVIKILDFLKPLSTVLHTEKRRSNARFLR